MGSAGTGRDVFRPPRVARKDRMAQGARRFGVPLVIALGGGLGSVARFLVGAVVPGAPGRFPWPTLVINVTGCFALGLLMVLLLDVWPPRRYVRPFLGIGFIGGYTTFSTVTVEILGLPGAQASAYALGSLASGLAAVWSGMTLARLVARIPVRRRPGEEVG